MANKKNSKMFPAASPSFRSYRSPTYSGSNLSSIPESEPFISPENGDLELGIMGRGENGTDAVDEIIPRTRHPRRSKLWHLLSLTASSLGFQPRENGSCLGRDVSTQNDSKRKPSISRRLLGLLILLLMVLGLLQLLGLLIGLAAAFFPNRIDRVFSALQGQSVDNLKQWPIDATADILPIRCHSHNDYWRKVPLKSAIKAGCTSVEADVWLYGGELYVGHSEASLSSNRTLSTLYVNPLLELLDQQNPITDFHPALDILRNGVFDTDSSQSLILLIDFKTDGEKLWQVVSAQLEPFRAKQYLTYFDGSTLQHGPITVVVTGNAPFNLVVANTTYRDMFFDAPLAKMASLASNPPAPSPLLYNPTKEESYLDSIASRSPEDGSDGVNDHNNGQGQSGLSPTDPSIYSPFNSYFASTSLKASIGIPFPYFASLQRTKIQQQIAGAHSLGLQVRYWDTPAWPVSWRNYLWRELVTMGIDYLNVDDLESAAKGDWQSEGGLGRVLWGMGGW